MYICTYGAYGEETSVLLGFRYQDHSWPLGHGIGGQLPPQGMGGKLHGVQLEERGVHARATIPIRG